MHKLGIHKAGGSVRIVYGCVCTHSLFPTSGLENLALAGLWSPVSSPDQKAAFV